MDDVVRQCDGLTEGDIAFLQKIERDLDILADISRSDVLMCAPFSSGRAAVIAQARPHSIAPVHAGSLLGHLVTSAEQPLVLKTLERGRFSQGDLRLVTTESPIMQKVHPIHNAEGKVIGALSIETNLLEHERHNRRSRVFQRALRLLQQMVLRGDLEGAHKLSPFGEHDGIMVIDERKRIQYMSGIATNLYRKIGYVESLIGERVSSLKTADDNLASIAMKKGRCIEQEVHEGNRIWIKKVIPLATWETRPADWRKFLSWPTRNSRPPYQVMLTIHDETEARYRERELTVKSAMIQEVHHRVKNNLQTIVSLLRMSARRAKSEETRLALEEGINRIMSVAVIHEFLSHQESQVINIREVGQRIINQMQQGVLDPEKQIRLDLRGPNVYLPARQATACAMVINELLQNAVEHGYERRPGGTVSVQLVDEGDGVTVTIQDDGVGLPADFDREQAESLGLQIVQTLVEHDLRGQFELTGGDGVRAIVSFPKLVGGGETWNELE
jgi:two-component sensor histidine kinase